MIYKAAAVLFLCGLFLGTAGTEEAFGQGQIFSTSINPDEYLVGPGDRFKINFWTETTPELTVTVSPEGFLLIESMGQADVGGLRLTEARSKLDELIGRFYSLSDFSVSLDGVRPVQILVTGAVNNPGLYKGFASERVSEIIARAGGPAPGASHRNIEFRSESYSYIVDLIKFNRLGDLSANPYIYSGHHLHIPVIVDSTCFVHVSGEVVSPGKFEFKPGDKVESIIRMAFGFTGLENDQIIIYRKNGGEVDELTVNKENIDIDVQAGDKIIVGRNLAKSDTDYFIISGEVSIPGTYPYHDGLNLQEAINNAGGLTGRADIYSAAIFRQAERIDDTRVIDKKFANIFLYPVTFERDELLPDQSDRLPINRGDSIHIPAASGSIGVYGMVQNPGQLTYFRPLSVISCINGAGGYSPGADKRMVEIIRKSTDRTDFVDPSQTAYDGDVIFVRNNPREKSFWDRLKDFTLIVGGLSLTYLAIDNITD